MELIGPKYISGGITIKSLRDFIVDSSITEADTIVLNPNNFDNIVLEHRREYGVGIEVPYFLLGILIDEDVSYEVPRDRVFVIKNDKRENRMPILENQEEQMGTDEILYRCGWCGNVVDYDGSAVSNEERNRKIQLHQKYGSEMPTQSVNGYCCPNGDEIIGHVQ